jgi:hypothetical protein
MGTVYSYFGGAGGTGGRRIVDDKLHEVLTKLFSHDISPAINHDAVPSRIMVLLFGGKLRCDASEIPFTIYVAPRVTSSMVAIIFKASCRPCLVSLICRRLIGCGKPAQHGAMVGIGAGRFPSWYGGVAGRRRGGNGRAWQRMVGRAPRTMTMNIYIHMSLFAAASAAV